MNNQNKIKIAIILPIGKNDYLADTVLDGFYQLIKDSQLNQEKDSIEIAISSHTYPSKLAKRFQSLDGEGFVSFARAANMILLFGCHNGTIEYAEKIGAWDKTVFMDGSELGKSRKLDPDIVRQVNDGSYSYPGRVNVEMLKKCALYFRREKPYRLLGKANQNGGKEIIPLPFGIERKYVAYRLGAPKDIDFVCIFGQEDHPPLRREVRLALESFCEENGFSYRTKQTSSLFSGMYSEAARRRFYKLLARAKVGISVSGGGFDTVRFWEILGNNCLLITETIDIYNERSNALDYERIIQFKDLDDFKRQLGNTMAFLKNGYDSAETRDSMTDEYEAILTAHSSKSRVLAMLDVAERKGIIKSTNY